MFPTRDHLYELAKAHEIELMQMARREQQLAQARQYNYETWSLDGLRRLWQRFFGTRERPAASAKPPTLTRLNVSER